MGVEKILSGLRAEDESPLLVLSDLLLLPLFGQGVHSSKKPDEATCHGDGRVGNHVLGPIFVQLLFIKVVVAWQPRDLEVLKDCLGFTVAPNLDFVIFVHVLAFLG